MWFKANVFRIGQVMFIGAVGLLVITFLLSFFNNVSRAAKNTAGPDYDLERMYKKWAARYALTAPKGPEIRLTWNKGSADASPDVEGLAAIDLESGNVRVRINGLHDRGVSQVWLIAELPGPGRSILPEDSGRIHAGTLAFDDAGAFLQTTIDPRRLERFEVNGVVVAGTEQNPDWNGVLFGATSLFQRIYHYPLRTPLPWSPTPAYHNTAVAAGPE